jgi:hypothetical protein
MSSAQETKLTTPQPEHKLLERFAGEWTFEKKSAPNDASAPQSVGTGTITAELLGGFFVVCRWSGKLYETDYKAFQSLGYDLEKKKYTGCWVDSFMSYRWELSGTFDETSQELIVTSNGPGPTGKTATFRERYQFQSADSITIFGEMRQGEQWVTFSTTHLSRKH